MRVEIKDTWRPNVIGFSELRAPAFFNLLKVWTACGLNSPLERFYFVC